MATEKGNEKPETKKPESPKPAPLDPAELKDADLDKVSGAGSLVGCTAASCSIPCESKQRF